ncbi:MAG: hypothetical protein ABI835_12635 [Chloroflexota bacterium]
MGELRSRGAGGEVSLSCNFNLNQLQFALSISDTAGRSALSMQSTLPLALSVSTQFGGKGVNLRNENIGSGITTLISSTSSNPTGSRHPGKACRSGVKKRSHSAFLPYVIMFLLDNPCKD